MIWGAQRAARSRGLLKNTACDSLALVSAPGSAWAQAWGLRTPEMRALQQPLEAPRPEAARHCYRPGRHAVAAALGAAAAAAAAAAQPRGPSGTQACRNGPWGPRRPPHPGPSPAHPLCPCQPPSLCPLLGCAGLHGPMVGLHKGPHHPHLAHSGQHRALS